MHLINPFPAQAGGKAYQYLGTGTLGATALKKASPERLKEQLRILNYLAAPFGSQEDMLISYGVALAGRSMMAGQTRAILWLWYGLVTATALVAGSAVFRGGPGAYAANIQALRGG